MLWIINIGSKEWRFTYSLILITLGAISKWKTEHDGYLLSVLLISQCANSFWCEDLVPKEVR